jgi:hypothetical protein
MSDGLKRLLQVSLIYQEPSSPANKELFSWVKSQRPDLYSSYGLKEIAAKPDNPGSYKKLGMDGIPHTADGKLGSPAFHRDAYARAGLSNLPVNASGALASPGFHRDAYQKLGLGDLPVGQNGWFATPKPYNLAYETLAGVPDSIKAIKGFENCKTMRSVELVAKFNSLEVPRIQTDEMAAKAAHIRAKFTGEDTISIQSSGDANLRAKFTGEAPAAQATQLPSSHQDLRAKFQVKPDF